jgi:flagellar hook-associated protein 2
VSSFLDALATKVDGLVDRQTGATGSILDSRVESTVSGLKDLSSSIDAMNLRIDAEEQRYKAQFAAMESALANFQTQQAWLTGQLASLQTG